MTTEPTTQPTRILYVRRIRSINVRKHLVFVNFNDGTSGSLRPSADNLAPVGLSAAEVEEAKRLALENGRWWSWREPAPLPNIGRVTRPSNPNP